MIALKFASKVVNCSTRGKAVNPENCVATSMPQVQAKIAQWEGSINFLAIPMDDFDYNLRNIFFIKATVSVMPCACEMMLNDPKNA